MATLQFKGKAAVWNHHLSVPYHALEKDVKKSLKGADDAENLIIEGDNLLALKALLPQYQGRVKCIYIDPPYNTGNEGWKYSDNVSSPMIKDWLGETVGREGEDLVRHDKWLCMMTPRLKLLRELLASDGVIFVSIDDNEQYRLRALMDEVFGEKNYLNTFCWVNNLKGRQISGAGAAKTYESILVFAKNIEEVGLFEILIEKAKALMPSTYKGFDYEIQNDVDGAFVVKNELYNTNSAFNEKTRPTLVFTIHYNFKTKEVKFSDTDQKIDFAGFVKIMPKKNNDGVHRYHAWRWSKDKIIKDISDLQFLKTDSGAKIFTKVREHSSTSLKDLITDISTNKGSADIENLFEGKVFDYPKPVDLIKILVSRTSGDDIVLDSFAGSGTTAQAVLDLNEEDGGKRKFILVEMEGYANKLTAERIRRVIKRDKSKVGFTYYTLGPAIDADALLSGKLPKYSEFAKYVYYLATGKNHPDEKKIKEQDGFVGAAGNESVWLLYKQDMEALKTLAITLDWAQNAHKKEKGRKIVYAPACYLDDETLDQYNIKFVSIPYNLFEKQQ
ncbi:MAG: hypothetical protein A2758_01220 [Candidatus Zambryskibacteria bacterium RIFCSPHIGHO2_01_FULL_49_18]|uniref:DNA methylase N-4/N-6 domain-containing protein n=1 Tax=Candidatus Zambryskibacteria bacterium RIFCSPHIGHO2_01_FULL_49_18 TaxID=1802740 RepID=A0A1G2T4D2_9BACT|nr:MAG: hypothetical protein A2758_01220 [Candidatus Zambryskibacteria bacterium RIFCSPHIGHO2_01_FULL_49_18]